MAKMQTPNPVFLERNKRFVTLRKHYFKRQQDAADFLGISQPMLSYIEQGINDVNPSFIDKFVKELGASRQWYNEGIGQIESKGKPKPKSTLTDISDMKAKIENLERTVDQLRKNNNEMFKIVDQLQKMLEEK